MIRLESVSKSYDGIPVLENVSFSLQDGEAVCVTGSSGIGKTTLLRILMGLEAPDAGRVTGARGVRFAAVFQEDRLLERLSAVENALFVCGEALGEQSLSAAFAAVGLSPDDIAKPVRELSGGQRRRTALVRALLCPSDILVLDEPFTGLDDAARALCLDAVRAMRAGRALVCVTHDERIPALLGARLFHLGAPGKTVFLRDENEKRAL